MSANQHTDEETARENAAAGPEAASVQPKLSAWLIAALLGIVTIAAYFPSFQSGFIQFDDPLYITANPHVRSGLNWNNVTWAFTARSLDMGHWMPLTWLSHMADCQLFGLNPAGHHATSVILHAVCAVLLWWLLFKATGFRWRSLMVAALFALHPLNVENVAWIAERKSIVNMFFSLCAVGLYGWYARSPRWTRYLWVVIALALALMAKSMAVTLPVIFLLLDYWPLNRIGGELGKNASRVWPLVLEKVPLLAMSAVFSWIAILSQKSAGAIDYQTPADQRLRNAVISYVAYIRKMFWPSDLCFFYPHKGSGLSWWQASLAALLLVAITALVYRFRSRRHLVFGWAFYLIALLPVIGVLKIGMVAMADHYVYLPMIGLFIALVWEFAEAAKSLRVPHWVSAGVALLVVSLLSGCTMVTAGYWRSDLALFEHAHRVTSPPDVYVETNLAGALSDRGRLDEALVYYRHAESIQPTYFFAHYNVGYTEARTGDFAGAVDEFHQALRCAQFPAQKARTWKSLGIAYLNMDDKPKALEAFNQLLALQPNNAEAQQMIETLHSAGIQR